MSTPLAKDLWPACTSALQLDRLLVGELEEREAQEVRAHLAGCARCAAALDGLRAGRDAAPLPPLRLVPQPAAVIPLARARPSRWRRAAAASAGFAAAAALALVLRPAGPSERSKGSAPSLAMYVQHAGDVRRAGPGEVVAAGDAVRFAVRTSAPSFVAVIAIDPSGRGAVYFPTGARAEPVAPGAEVALPLATRLDATVGEERLVGLFCDSPVELEPLRARLERDPAAVPAGCQVTTWSFVKR